MINVRRGLISQVRGFFDTEIGDLYQFDEAAIQKGEPAPPRPDGRRNLEGQYREIVVFDFGPFSLRVASPGEKPPLGSIRLLQNDELCAEGPLDSATWAVVGRAVRERSHAIA